MLDRLTSKSLARLLQLLRPTPLSMDQQVVLATQIATWVWLAATGKVSAALAPDMQHISGDKVSHVFRKLRNLDQLDGNGDAFMADDSVLNAVPDVVLGNLVHEAGLLVVGSFIGAELVNEILVALGASAGRTGLFTMPQELVRLLIGLADIQPGDDVYTPFDDALQLSLAAAQAGARVFAELQSLSPLPYLLNLLADQRIHVNAGRNPIPDPSFIDGPRLKAFARTMSFPPMGVRFPLETFERDLYRRFKERTSSSSVLAVRHILAQTAGRAIIVTPNSLLSGVGVERSVREDLVHGGLEAVIALPPATLFGTPIPLFILVVNTQPPARTRNEVLFVDGSAERFHKRDGKGRSTLVGWNDLLQLVQQRQTGDHATLVPAEVIAANDYQLMVSRYARSQLGDAVDAVLREAKTVPLEDLVEFVRPLPISAASVTAELAVEALEVGVSDLPEYGYVSRPQKRVRLPALKNELRPLDIVIAVKGNVGKVGIVPPELDETWVAGQSCLILRLPDRRAHPVHTPHSLLLYLRSAVGKACLARITSGGTVPLIQLRELRRLAVLVPSLQKQAAATRTFEQLVELQQQIEGMREQQQVLASRLWQLPASAIAGAA
jgi:type I restriction enzyme M protein